MSDRKTITTNLFWKFAERILAQLVSFIVSIVLARLLLPEHYGTVAMVTVFITIANAFVTSGIPASLIQAKEAGEKEFSSVFYFNLFFSIILYILMFVSAPVIGAFYDDQLLVPVIRVMGIRIIIAAINSVQHSYVSRHMMFKKYFWSTLFGTLLSGAVGIWMAYSGFGVWALVAQYMTNTTVDTIVLFLTVKWRPTKYYSWAKVKNLLSFGWKMLFEGVFAVVYNQLRNLIIGKVYTSSDLAYYNRGEQLPSILVNNISVSISSVLFPAMSAIQDETEKVKSLLRKSIKMTSFVLFPLLFGLAMLSEPIIHILLTDKWNGSIPYLQLFCLIYAIQVGMYPRHQALNGIGRSDIFMIEHLVGRIFGIIVLVLMYKKSVQAVAISGLIGTIIQMGIIMYTSNRYSNYSYTEQIKDVIPSISGCVIMAPFILIVRNLITSDWLQFILSVPVCVLIYCLYSHIAKLEEYDYVKTIMKKIIKRKKAS